MDAGELNSLEIVLSLGDYFGEISMLSSHICALAVSTMTRSHHPWTESLGLHIGCVLYKELPPSLNWVPLPAYLLCPWWHTPTIPELSPQIYKSAVSILMGSPIPAPSSRACTSAVSITRDSFHACWVVIYFNPWRKLQEELKHLNGGTLKTSRWTETDRSYHTLMKGSWVALKTLHHVIEMP